MFAISEITAVPAQWCICKNYRLHPELIQDYFSVVIIPLLKIVRGANTGLSCSVIPFTKTLFHDIKSSVTRTYYIHSDGFVRVQCVPFW